MNVIICFIIEDKNMNVENMFVQSTEKCNLAYGYDEHEHGLVNY